MNEIRLRDMQPEDILNEIELRSEALLKADERAGRAEANFKAYEATAAMAIKDAGCRSMAEAEKKVRATEEWVAQYINLQTLRSKAAHLKRRYQKAIIAQDLWRTERATMRAA